MREHERVEDESFDRLRTKINQQYRYQTVPGTTKAQGIAGALLMALLVAGFVWIMVQLFLTPNRRSNARVQERGLHAEETRGL